MNCDYCTYVTVGIGDVTDYSLYPDKDYQLPWIREYLQEWSRLTGGPEVADTDVWKMYCGVNKCALVMGLTLNDIHQPSYNFFFLIYIVLPQTSDV